MDPSLINTIPIPSDKQCPARKLIQSQKNRKKKQNNKQITRQTKRLEGCNGLYLFKIETVKCAVILISVEFFDRALD